MRVELLVHRQDRVHRRLDRRRRRRPSRRSRGAGSCAPGCDLARPRHHRDEAGERLRSRRGGDREREQRVDRRAPLERQAAARSPFPSRAVGEAAIPAGAPESARYSVCVICSTLAPARAGAHAVHAEGALLLRRLHRPVDVHHAGRRLEDLLHLPRGLEARRCRPLRTPRPRASTAPADPAESRRSSPTRRSAARSSRSPGRTATAIAWLWRERSPFGHEVDLHVRDVRAAAHEVVPHEPVEVERRRRARVHLGALHLGHACAGSSRSPARARSLVSSVVPSGRSSTTWNSLLLSNGSIFTFTAFTSDEPHREQQQHDRRPVEREPATPRLSISGVMMRA